MENKKQNKPIAQFRAGVVSASVFAKTLQDPKTKDEFIVYSVNLQKAYKDEQGEWQHTSSLSVNDTPRAIAMLQEAYKFVITQKKESDE